jgi:hypothetical protein
LLRSKPPGAIRTCTDRGRTAGYLPAFSDELFPQDITAMLKAKGGYFVFAWGTTRLLRIDGMLSRTESIDGFHLKLSRTEKELYEEFLKTEEAEILAEMQQYFAEAKQKAGGIRFCFVEGLIPVRAFLFCFTSLPNPGTTNSPFFLVAL